MKYVYEISLEINFWRISHLGLYHVPIHDFMKRYGKLLEQYYQRKTAAVDTSASSNMLTDLPKPVS